MNDAQKRKVLTIVVLAIFVLASAAFVIYHKVQKGARDKAYAELTHYRKNMDTAIGDLEFHRHVNDLSQAPLDYAAALIKAMNARSLFGQEAFDQKEKDEFYRQLVTRMQQFKQALIDYYPEKKPLSAKQKITVMEKIITNTELYFNRGMKKDDDMRGKILKAWADSDRTGLQISSRDLPEPQAEEAEEETGFRDEIAKFEPVDGKLVEKTHTVPMQVSVRAPISYSSLKDKIGDKIDVYVKSGHMFSGLLQRVNDKELVLEVYLEGGSYIKQIARSEIERMEKVTFKKVGTVMVQRQPRKKKKADESLNTYKEMPHLQSPEGEKGYYCFVTRDNKMYVVGLEKGELVLHDKTTKDGFTPRATVVSSNDISSISLESVTAGGDKKTYPLTELSWVMWDEKTKKWIGEKGGKEMQFKNFKPFNLTFKIRLYKTDPNTGESTTLDREDVVINQDNVIFACNSLNMAAALKRWGNGKHGKGDKAWVYEAVRGKSSK